MGICLIFPSKKGLIFYFVFTRIISYTSKSVKHSTQSVLLINMKIVYEYIMWFFKVIMIKLKFLYRNFLMMEFSRKREGEKHVNEETLSQRSKEASNPEVLTKNK